MCHYLGCRVDAHQRQRTVGSGARNVHDQALLAFHHAGQAGSSDEHGSRTVHRDLRPVVLLGLIQQFVRTAIHDAGIVDQNADLTF